jgi:hypothetical protein
VPAVAAIHISTLLSEELAMEFLGTVDTNPRRRFRPVTEFFIRRPNEYNHVPPNFVIEENPRAEGDDVAVKADLSLCTP